MTFTMVELAGLRQKLEDLSNQARDKMDAAVAREEYGEAQYHRGQQHALTLASLRVKSLEHMAGECPK